MHQMLHAAFRSALVAAATAIFAATPVFAESDDDGDDDGFHSLDSVDGGKTHSLDSVDDGRTHSLGSADDGSTHSLDSADEGSTHSLDSADDGSTHSLDSVDDGRSMSLDSVDESAEHATDDVPAAAPIALPPIENGNWEAQAERARSDLAAAKERLDLAQQRYANMIRNDYPRGDARAVVISERDAAQRAITQAEAYLAQLEERAAAAGRPL